jgi:hypothetical protein
VRLDSPEARLAVAEALLREDAEFERLHPRSHGRFIRKFGGEVRNARKVVDLSSGPRPSGGGSTVEFDKFVERVRALKPGKSVRHENRAGHVRVTRTGGGYQVHRRLGTRREEHLGTFPLEDAVAAATHARPIPQAHEPRSGHVDAPDVSGGVGPTQEQARARAAAEAKAREKERRRAARQAKSQAATIPSPSIGELSSIPTRKERQRKERAAAKRAERARKVQAEKDAKERKRLARNAAARKRRADKKKAAELAANPPRKAPNPRTKGAGAPKPMTKARGIGAVSKLQPGDEVRVGGRHGVVVGHIGGLKTPRMHVYFSDNGEHRYIRHGEVKQYRRRDAKARENLLRTAQAGTEPDTPHARRLSAALGAKPRRRSKGEAVPVPYEPRAESGRNDPTPRPSGLVYPRGHPRQGEEMLTTTPPAAAHPRHLLPGDEILYGPPGTFIGGQHGVVLDRTATGLVVWNPRSRTADEVRFGQVHHVMQLANHDRIDNLRQAPAGRSRAAIAAVRKERAVNRLVDAQGEPAWFRNPVWDGAPDRQGGQIVRWPSAPGDKAPPVGEPPAPYAERNWVRGGEPGTVVRTAPDGLLPGTPRAKDARAGLKQLGRKGMKASDRRPILDHIDDVPEGELMKLSKDELWDLSDWSARYVGYEDLWNRIERVWARRGFTEAFATAAEDACDVVLAEAITAIGMPLSPRLRRRRLRALQRRRFGSSRWRTGARTSRKLRRQLYRGQRIRGPRVKGIKPPT